MRYRLLLVFLVLLCASPLLASDLPTPEYQVKAAYLYNFLKLARFPSTKIEDTGQLHLCVVGEQKLSEYFKNIVGKKIRQLSLKVTFLSTDEDIASCHLLFITEAKRSQTVQWLDRAKGHAILTVGEIEDFCTNGGMIRFFLESETVQFELNENAASVAHIEFDSALSAVAHTPVK